MTLDDFIEQVDGWPEELIRVAEVGQDCEDADVASACQAYIIAERKLLDLLEELDVELG